MLRNRKSEYKVGGTCVFPEAADDQKDTRTFFFLRQDIPHHRPCIMCAAVLFFRIISCILALYLCICLTMYIVVKLRFLKC